LIGEDILKLDRITYLVLNEADRYVNKFHSLEIAMEPLLISFLPTGQRYTYLPSGHQNVYRDVKMNL